jgi:N-acetyl-1-D-myo-inositol-2-amino-2-deoxy-alpha-D-glucopyranoside deacetylase
MASGVLAVFAHPDDETLLAGGALAGCAAAGLRVAIISMTRGERGPVAGSELLGGRTLAELREAELAAAGAALGAAHVTCMDYPDGELEQADEQEAATALAAVIEDERPKAVISFSEEGLYWHPDHLAVARFIPAAIRLLSQPDRPPWVYGATWPHGHAARLVSSMRARGLPSDLWGIAPEAFGAPAGAITTSVDVRPFLHSKLDALRAHRSQLAPEHLLAALPDDVAEEFLGREYFVRQAPAPAPADWLTRALARGTGPPLP